MTYIAPNSVHARDIAHFIHPQTGLVRHEQEGPVVISRGRGIYVYDESGREYLEGRPACGAPRSASRTSAWPRSPRSR